MSYLNENNPHSDDVFPTADSRKFTATSAYNTISNDPDLTHIKPRDLHTAIHKLFRQHLYFPGVWQGVRKLTKGKAGKKVSMFPSLKNGCQMPCESSLEQASCRELEFNEYVTCYATQPFSIQLSEGQSYTPDVIYIDIHGIPVVREIKASKDLSCLKTIGKLEKARRLLARQDIEYEIMTELHLLQQPHCDNQYLLYKHSHEKLADVQTEQASEILSKQASLSLREFRDACSEIGLPFYAADRLLMLGLAIYDTEKKLSADSMVYSIRGEA